MEACTYNGWTNWETWAAALWIDNEEPNYRAKQAYFRHCQRCGCKPTFTGLLRFARLVNTDLSWRNSRISRGEITADLQTDFADWQRNN